MEGKDRPFGTSPSPWGPSIDEDHLAQPTILVVEDDRDIREMIAMLLEMSGFSVVACDAAEGGLNALREQEFDLILTDYALPGRSGLWLLEEAESEGLLQGTPVLIVTAHPHVEAGGRYEVIHKPFDLDQLIERVRRRLEGSGGSRPRRVSLPAPTGQGAAGGTPGCPDPVELILYVSSPSPRSKAAVQDVKKVLERFGSARVRLTVCDLSANANGDVEGAPALVRRTLGPRTFILGHITNPELLLELLADCGADPN